MLKDLTAREQVLHTLLFLVCQVGYAGSRGSEWLSHKGQARLIIDHYLTHLVQLLSCRRASDARGEQEVLSCFKKHAKIIVSHFSPGDE